MRRMIVAAIAVGVLLTAGCQDNEARTQNARLQAQLDAMKQRNNNGGSDVVAQILAAQAANKDSGALEKKVNSLSEDISAGLDDIKKNMAASDEANKKRVDSLEDQVKKFTEVQATIATLKSMVESLESKVKSVDPNEVLTAKGQLLEKENDLRLEKQAREQAEKDLADAKQQLVSAQDKLKQLQDQVSNLQGADISKHPDYIALKKENKKLQNDLNDKEDVYKSLKRKYDTLVEQLKKGANPPDTTQTPELTEYDFSGKVTDVSKGAHPDGPSYLLIGSVKFKDSAPPVGTELVVIDEKNNPICKVKVIRLYHYENKEDLPVDEIGCQTIKETTTRPVVKGDTVVWIKKDEDKKPKTESGIHDSAPSNNGTAGGN